MRAPRKGRAVARRVVTFRVTIAERAELRERARATQLNVSEFVRALVFSKGAPK